MDKYPGTNKRKASKLLQNPTFKRVNSLGDIPSASSQSIHQSNPTPAGLANLEGLIDSRIQNHLDFCIQQAVKSAMNQFMAVMKESDSKISSLAIDLKTTVEKLCERDRLIDKYNEQIDNLSAEMSCLKATLDETKSELKELKEENALSSDRAEQYSRRECLRINGLTLLENETTDDAICRVARAVNVTISKSDISRSHFIGKQKTQIIAKFTSYRKRSELLQARKSLQMTPSLSNVYINEDLTKLRFSLFKSLLSLKKQGKIHSAWTHDGNVFFRATESADKKLARTERDIKDSISL